MTYAAFLVNSVDFIQLVDIEIFIAKLSGRFLDRPFRLRHKLLLLNRVRPHVSLAHLWLSLLLLYHHSWLGFRLPVEVGFLALSYPLGFKTQYLVSILVD